MRPMTNSPKISDSLSKESFFIALKKHIEVMKSSKQVSDPMVFGTLKITKTKYINSLLKIIEHENDWLEWINDNFVFHEVYGRSHWSEVMATGYYEPLVRGSHFKKNTYSQALFATPIDLMTINPGDFGGQFYAGNSGVLKGRIENKKFIPYYTRKEINSEYKLKDQNLELAWVDPVDAFFMQIQGTGVVEFENGDKIRLGFDNHNGHRYAALGKLLKEVIPPEQISMQGIKEYLKTLSLNEQEEVLNKNPRYVFFKKLESGPLTYAGMEVSEGRTIATDLNYFPKGALAFLDIEEPQFEKISDLEPRSWKSMPRFVLDEDIGAAIHGGDRVDLYLGHGELAAQKAGVMKQKGRLYYLVPLN